MGRCGTLKCALSIYWREHRETQAGRTLLAMIDVGVGFLIARVQPGESLHQSGGSSPSPFPTLDWRRGSSTGALRRALTGGKGLTLTGSLLVVPSIIRWGVPICYFSPPVTV